MRDRRPGPEPDPGSAGPIVIGLGNLFRGDDGVGLLVARRLRPRLDGRGSVVEASAEGAALLDLWNGRSLALVVDAVTTGAPPGTIHRIEVGTGPLPAALSATSSHAFSLAQAVALGQTLHRMPRRLVVYGVEALCFDPGTEISRPVAQAIPTVTRRIERELDSTHSVSA
jgi:hydrogenase maturation protease